jgi:ATP-dependent helicase/nuclease subunit A
MEFDGRPNTVKTKQSLWKNWVEPNLNPDGSNLAAVVNLWEAHLKPNTVKSLIYIAKDWVRQNTGKDLEVRKHVTRVGRSQQQEMPRAFSKAEIVALVDALDPSDPLYLPFMIGLHTGMRRGEVWGLTWDDIDVLKDQITIQRSYDGPTKTGKSRIVPISFKLEQVFLAIPEFITYNTYRAKGKRKRSANNNVVPNNFDPNPQLRGLMKKAGVPQEGRTWHSLRHTFATLALEAGKSPKLVSLCLGHSSLSTTLNLYWSTSKEKLSLDFLDE